MDYGYLNDQKKQAVHTLDAIGMDLARQSLPEAWNPWEKHYEETEKDSLRWHRIFGGQNVHKIPPQFGHLLHSCPDGLYRVRYNKGFEHGMARPEDSGDYEAAKFNQRLNPRSERVGNYRIDNANLARTEDDMKAGIFAQFPSIGGPVTSAPFKASGNPFAKEEMVQDGLFFVMFWNHPELKGMLIEELFTHHEALSHFTRSCQYVRRGVEEELGFFATNRLDFHKCDKSPQELQALLRSGELTQDFVENLRIPKFLVVGPVRYNMNILPGFHGDPKVFWPPQIWPADEQDPHSHENLFNEYGFPKVVRYTQKRKHISHFRNGIALQKFLKTIYYHRRHFHFLDLRHLDLMNLQTLEAILNDLPNLKGLKIQSCRLIDLSQVRNVIKLVGRVNNERRKVNKRFVDLDIAPPVYQGPIGSRTGSYGVTQSDPQLYNNWGTDVGHAFAASLVSLLREAERAGIQLCTPGKAFRLYMDKIPFNINQAYNICITTANYLSNEKTRWDYASQMYPDPRDSADRFRLVKKFDDTVAMDLIAAATAKPVRENDFLKQGKFICTICGESLPGIFFRAESQDRDPRWVTCEGCELNSQLEFERGNSQLQVGDLASFLWRDSPDYSIDWVLGDFPEAERNWRILFKTAKQMPTTEQLLSRADVLKDERRELIRQIQPICNWAQKRLLVHEIDTITEKIELLHIRAGFQRQPKTCRATEYDWDYRRRAYTWRCQAERGEECRNYVYST